MAEHNEIGKIGENIAKTFLMKHDFVIIDTNYGTKYGELDIVATKDNVLHFIEVKSVKVINFDSISNLSVAPEDNLTSSKLQKVKISSQIYSRNKFVTSETPQCIDLACVYICMETREGRVKFLENI